MAEATLTGSERIAAAFGAAGEEGRAALMPYMMAGFPDRESSLAVAEAYADAGADLIELGIPFSDPLADGPTIHAAATKALAGGATLETALEVCESVSARVPVLFMVYSNMVLAQGGARRLRPPRRGGRGGGRDRPRPAAGGGRRDSRGARRRGPGSGPAAGADHSPRAAGAHLRRREGLRLRRLDRRHHRGAPPSFHPHSLSWSPRPRRTPRCRSRSASASAARSRPPR